MPDNEYVEALKAHLDAHRETQKEPEPEPQEDDDEGLEGVKTAQNSHNLAWEQGQHGKGMFDRAGNLHTWPVDDNYEPNHTDYAAENGLHEHHAPPYLYIYPDGKYTPYGGDNIYGPARIDPRLKPEDELPDEWQDLK